MITGGDRGGSGGGRGGKRRGSHKKLGLGLGRKRWRKEGGHWVEEVGGRDNKYFCWVVRRGGGIGWLGSGHRLGVGGQGARRTREKGDVMWAGARWGGVGG